MVGRPYGGKGMRHSGFFRLLGPAGRGGLRFLLLLLSLFGLWTTGEAAKRSEKKFVVVIDAGHGGHDVGAEGSFSTEKDVNLNIVLEVERLMKAHQKDVKLILTRRSDMFLSWEERAQIANRNRADLFLSVHTNSSEGSKVARGTESYYAGQPPAAETKGTRRTSRKKAVAKPKINVVTEAARNRTKPQSELFARLLQCNYMTYGKRINRGAKRETYYVLMHTHMPAALTEVGFISTLDEEAYLTSKKGIRELAQSICASICQYKTIMEKGRQQAELTLLRCGKLPKVAGEVSMAMQRLSESALNSTSAREERENVPAQETSVRKAEAEKIPDAGEPPVFSLQILTSTEVLDEKDYRLKGLAPVTFVKCGAIYKCLYGSSADYDAVRALQKEVREKFADAFVVAFRAEVQVPTADAIRAFRERKSQTGGKPSGNDRPVSGGSKKKK